MDELLEEGTKWNLESVPLSSLQKTELLKGNRNSLTEGDCIPPVCDWIETTYCEPLLCYKAR